MNDKTKRFMVVSGFLGSGKTTLMMALTNALNAAEHCSYMISNDLGGRGLADYRFSKACNCRAEELTGECICFQTENLIERLRRLYTDGGAELIMSDIPGFGVGALDHVYHRLHTEYPDECTLSPFTVVTEPATIRKLIPGDTLSTLPNEMVCILRSQLDEADLIVLNKADIMTDDEKTAILAFLSQYYPDTPVQIVSALTGEGIEKLAAYLLSHGSALKKPDFAFEEKDFSAAFGKLCEYYTQFYVQVCCNDFNANEYLCALGNDILQRLLAKNYDVPHLKIYAQNGEDDFCMVDQMGKDRGMRLTMAMKKRVTDLPVIMNASAICSAEDMNILVDAAIQTVSKQFDLSVFTFSRECFGCADEGRI